ncbi:TIGR02569 family protein [Amycolatopsis antarctica]|uniref:TIGR02569 family protein n=1 Tax=Amycolatopsis antarctica TaxID=1854586 RepID=A0A263DCN8_9PSEU|nr:TIGR02569 family protein [Amycolatopsis antarctica]OZM75145.1 TIGR02569 family protein [Amycolatopsis antarctica]
MTADRQPPPAHVCAAFGARAADAEPLPDGSGWLAGGTVLRPVTDRTYTMWLSRTLQHIDVPDLRIGKPLRSTDGRYVLAGWSAYRHVSGRPEYRVDSVMLAAIKLHQATVDLPRPDFLGARTDIYARADRMAWEEQDADLTEAGGGRLFEVLAGARRELTLPDQLVHGDLLGRVLFDGDAAPGIVDFSPYFRPAEWGAAIVAVDAVAWGDADPELLRRWAHLPEWPQLLLRALLFRIAVHAQHPQSTDAAFEGLRLAAREVSELL